MGTGAPGPHDLLSRIPVESAFVSELVISGLRKVFKGKREAVTAVDGVDLRIESGELLVLLGPSGCGKTTLLRCIAGLEQPTAGSVTIAGEVVVDCEAGIEVPPHRRSYGMVFQNYALWPHLTVGKNVEYPLRSRKIDRGSEHKRAQEVLGIVRCGHLSNRYPAELSGGQQQRIALARALAPRPEVLLLDEPLSNLDALLRIELRAELRRVHREVGYTGVYVTHDQSEALGLATRVAVMRAGKVEQLASPEELYNSPSSEYVAEFLGVRNAVDLTRNEGGWSTPLGTLRCDTTSLDPSQTHRLRVRPQDVDVFPAGWEPDNGIVTSGLARVSSVLYQGSALDLVLQAPGGEQIHVTTPARNHSIDVDDELVVAIGVHGALLYTNEYLVPGFFV